jgi:hypothetical protein
MMAVLLIILGELFKNGYGIPLNKYKALEWLYHSMNKTQRDKSKGEDYHRSATDKSEFNSITDSLY